MTKPQILSKAILNGLCFFALGLLMAYVDQAHRLAAPDELWLLFLDFIGIGLMVLWVIPSVLKSFRPAFWMAGKTSGDTSDKMFYIPAIRLAAVTAGLILLALYWKVAVHTVESIVSLIPSGMEFFNALSEDAFTRVRDLAFGGIVKLVYPFGLMIWIGYLLAGAPHLVRGQIRLLENIPTKSIQGEEHE